MLQLYRRKCQLLNEAEIGNTHLVLIEGLLKKTGQLVGRNELYLKVAFDQADIEAEDGGYRPMRPGDYVAVRITGARASVLTGVPLRHTTLRQFYKDASWGERSPLRQ